MFETVSCFAVLINLFFYNFENFSLVVDKLLKLGVILFNELMHIPMLLRYFVLKIR